MRGSQQLNIAVFASGQGSNFQAIAQSIKKGKIPSAKLVLVVSDNANAGALELARTLFIPAVVLNPKQISSEQEYPATLKRILHEHHVSFIVLAGYLKKLPSELIHEFKNRIVNIHPALLPNFGGKGMYGMRVHEAVLAAKSAESGATVHIVEEEYDRGPIVLQRKIEVLPGDTPESLAARVLKVEHELYPEALRLFAEGKVHIENHRVKILHDA
jgi:phosphoribosylglycinamide formyltransferase-1